MDVGPRGQRRYQSLWGRQPCGLAAWGQVLAGLSARRRLHVRRAAGVFHAGRAGWIGRPAAPADRAASPPARAGLPAVLRLGRVRAGPLGPVSVLIAVSWSP